MLSLNFLRRATLGLALVLPLLVSAQSWPNKPIKWIIPYPPGGITDNATLYAGKLPYDVVKSFALVSLVGIAPLVMAVNNNLPAKDIRELMAYSKANPGKLAFGSSGVGAAAHLTQELFKQVTSIDMVHIPYKGTAPALTDLMAATFKS